MESNLKDDKPIFQQIAEKIETSILDGSIQEGDRVPSTNEFAKFYQINPATAAKGINQLVDQEIVYKKRGIGMFVAEGAREIILGKRKDDFYKDFIVPIKTEAGKLGISVDELKGLLERGDLK
ncbi:GntR family transcriptional regulator [Anaerobacillus isosaccharinicus]|uniref:GntR family transcriptional regulator n=1 Tax=Anaerobacillus isosaccharinicus TaxID=1532552 RepID=A0A1S2KZE6_9BACI|nr:GntR family transcriptional regulator [Anaerobacillus isosaccharinicus]MBA5587558.1 GntR family transcriptional regulator [Anaerobacillus isosaccharinicus]QOY34265.1 GntR family transcriptional regulator [Anaerobacillus isosaccharinicus]